MFENNIQNLNLDATIQQNGDNVSKKKVSFKGNPNAVDTTPVADTYQTQPQAPADSPLRTAAFVLPTWYGLNKSADLFNKACGGEYEKSLMGKLGRWGDSLSNSKVFNNSFFNSIGNWWGRTKVKTQAFIDKHPMLSAMQKTPTEPEHSMPRAFMESQNECDIKEATAELEKFIQGPEKNLKNAGASKAEIDALKAKYGTNWRGKIKNEALAVEEFQLTKLGGKDFFNRVVAEEKQLVDAIDDLQRQLSGLRPGTPEHQALDDVINNLRQTKKTFRADKLTALKKQVLGLTDDALASIKNNPLSTASYVEKALEKASVVSPNLSRHSNKLKAMHKPLTKLGKLLPKLSKLGVRGLTFGGGLLNTAFIAFPLATSIKNTVDAPKENKSGTLAHGVMEAMSWVISMPLALVGMHSVNGLKNTGVSKEAYANFKNELKAFNLKAKNGGFASLAEWTAEKNRINALKSVSGKQSLFTRGIKKVAQFLSIGLEQFTPYKADTSALTGAAKRSAMLGNIKRMAPNFLRNLVGYPLRFGLYMFAFQPIVDKLMTWGTKAIFGEAYDPEKIKEEQAKAAERRAALYPGPRFLPNPEAENGVGTVDVNSLSNKNLIKQKITGVTSDMPDAPVVNGYTPPPVYDGINAAPATMVKGEPFMPPSMPTNNNPQQPATNGSDSVDKVPRYFTPEFDINAPVPYSDPMEDPNNPRGRAALQNLINANTQTLQDLNEYKSNGYKNKSKF